MRFFYFCWECFFIGLWVLVCYYGEKLVWEKVFDGDCFGCFEVWEVLEDC